MSTDRLPVERAEALAMPFILGMALGLAIGRFLGGFVVGIPVGLTLFVVFAWIRSRLVALPQ